MPYRHVKVTEERLVKAGLKSKPKISQPLIIEPRGKPRDTSHHLHTEAIALSGYPDLWEGRIRAQRPGSSKAKSRVHCGTMSAIGSGDMLSAAEGAPERVGLIQVFKKDAIGLEMEAYGTAIAARAYDVPMLVIKGVQDDGTGNKDDTKEKDVWRRYAADAAAAFTIALIERYEFPFESDVLGAGNLRSLLTWNALEIYQTVSHAKQSIEIVDTYYDEAPHLASLAVNAIHNGARSLRISIYMLDPDGMFGAQRLLEIETFENRAGKDWKRYKAKYRQTFDAARKSIWQSFHRTRELHEAGILPELYIYGTMPGMRILAIDDESFVVGWFPQGDINPAYPCFIVRKSSSSEHDKTLVKKLRQQLVEIRKNARHVDLKPSS